MEKELAVDEVVFRNDLYPRIKTRPEVVQRYAEVVDMLPPIEINQHNELIDGWHRWTAHKKAERETIRAVVTPTKTEREFLFLAMDRNAKHGAQLNNADKRAMAIRMYGSCVTPNEKKACEEALVEHLSVHEKTIDRWLSDLKRAEREERNRRIADLWLACHTQAEIANATDVPQQTVADQIKSYTETEQVSKIGKTFDPEMATFERKLYDIWNYPRLTNLAAHPGNSEQGHVKNLLALYTAPRDIVVDPFAGGGSTIDACHKHFRRYWVSDLTPIVERADEIRQWDITQGMPPLGNRWSDVRLVYLDPPYWNQLQGEYSNKATDLSNMPLEAFHTALFGVLKGFVQKLPVGAKIALLIQPTQWKSAGRQVIDHTDQMRFLMRSVPDVRFKQKFSVPYKPSQYQPQQVEAAKEDGLCLVLTREMTVWEVTR